MGFNSAFKGLIGQWLLAVGLYHISRCQHYYFCMTYMYQAASSSDSFILMLGTAFYSVTIKELQHIASPNPQN
jgi:hypothetical protein